VTVAAMLDAAVKLLKREGAAAITTNRIAEIAGVSIGPVYQYFPNKHAIFIALHQRHIDEVERMMQKKILQCEGESLEKLVVSLVDGMVETHRADPELSELLQSEVPHRVDGTREFSVRLHRCFRDALASHRKSSGGRVDPDLSAFILSNTVEALGHAVVLRRPTGLSLQRAKAEMSKALLAYLKL
jgi:AcrR family transcriptional regulator